MLQTQNNNDRWLISYADFITLLFAFFVVMYAISSVNNGKYRVMADSIIEAFNDPEKTLQPIQVGVFEQAPRSDQPVASVEAQREGASGETDREDDRGTQPAGDQQTRGEVDELTLQAHPDEQQPAIDEGDLIEEIARNISDRMKPQIEQDAISVSQSDDFIEVEINNNVLFPSGSARLHTDAIPILSSLSEIFNTFNNAIQVEGFTDNEPIRTTAYPSNWELSAARAASVVHLFMKSGIRPERMAAVGYGEHRPIASNETEEGRRRNRRVVIVIPAVDQGQHIMDSGSREIRRGATGQQRIPMDLQ
ncbi:MAG: flagellar motor protein MotD [Thiotrichales bacterium]|nr:flagellar motor protein MotD [Thiotrichales bacterium]